jgi:antitoxin VapB
MTFNFNDGRRAGLETVPLLGICWHMPKIDVPAERRVKVFRNGRNQAVRIPREFEFPGNEAVMRKEGNRLIIEPAPPRSLLAVLARLKPLKEAFPRIEDKPPGSIEI